MKSKKTTPKKLAGGKRSISASEDLFKLAEERMRVLRIDNFSEYARILIRRDLEAAEKAA